MAKQRIAIDELKPGMVIVQITQQFGPVAIKKSGLVTSFDMVDGLREMGIAELEIDTDQTVEIDVPDIPKSQTQQLLQSTLNTASQVEHSMSEQFNRSLFLPSIQDIPSMWQIYMKHAAVVVLVVCGGFGIGWTTATFDSWDFPIQMSQGEVAQNSATKTQQSPIQQSPIQPSPSVPKPIVNDQAQLSETQPSQPLQQATIASVSDVEKTKVPPPEIDEHLEMEQQGGVTLNEPASDANVTISPVLLQRFEQAVAELEKKSDQQPEMVERFEEPQSDVIMVHELPARILTQLPAMAFSAHMYASDANERWVRVNGRRVVEGQGIADGLELVAIEPQRVILRFRGEEFAMSALTDW